MKYKNIYDCVEAVVYTGFNFTEVNNFCENRLSWKSETTDWADDNPPTDLIVNFKDGDNNDVLVPGNFIVKFGDRNYGVIEGYDFIRLFERAK